MQAFVTTAFAVGVITCSSLAWGEECATVNRANVVQCAEAASLRVRAQQKDVEIASARATTAATILPSNPTLLITGGRRNADALPGATNWYATLAQEVEVAGQRGLRRDAATHEISAGKKQLVAVERDVAAAALTAYFDALAAGEQLVLAGRLDDVGRSVAVATRARADTGVASPLEAEVADASALALVRARLAARREAERTRIELMALLARESISVEGQLVPLAAPSGMVIDQQPEVQALEEQRRSVDAQASVLRRARVPNPTFQFYVQNDGFNERVYGGGLSIPIPLPAPLGRVNRGEIAEAEARASRVAAEAEQGRREIRRRVGVAAESYELLRREVDAFTPERVKQAEQTLAAIGTEVSAGRLAIRDAVVAQQTLIELLRGYIVARRDLCVASVELARAAGAELERGTK